MPTLAEIRAEKARRSTERERERIARDADQIRLRCRTLAGFVREAWHVLEPNARYVHNWHIDAVCSHLEAITYGRFTKLLCNIWPGSSKSLIVSVMWQAWEWGPAGLPSMRHLATAFNDGPVKRDTRKCRDLIMSEWYRSLWPEVTLTRTAEMSFANSSTGTREGVAFGSLTSQRGDRLIIDDPHSTETAESVAERQTTTRKFREGALNRLNDQERSAIVVIMQRLHEDDVSGVIKKLGMDFVHLCLPMEFELERRCSTPIGFVDPREAEGDLADPVRFPREVVDALKRDMGSYAYAGQYQQRPTPRSGGLFKRHWFDFVAAAPADRQIVRGWDLAASIAKTGTNPAFTAGVKLSRDRAGIYYVENVVRIRESAGQVQRLIRNTAEHDTARVKVSIPQDPGQAGKAQVASFAALLAGFAVRFSPESGDKVERAAPVSAQAEAGNMKIVRTGDPARDAWIDAFLDEAALFPGGSHKDQVDALSRAFGHLISAPTDIPIVTPFVQTVPRQFPG